MYPIGEAFSLKNNLQAIFIFPKTHLFGNTAIIDDLG